MSTLPFIETISSFLSGLLALVSGGVLLTIGAALWESFKFFYPDLQQWFKKRSQAKSILFESLDPTLKAADELYGKLTSLAKEDFATFINPNNSNSSSPEHNGYYVCYLFAQFWACLEHVRINNNYSSITKIKKGKELLRFIETFEARNYRILDRSKQRIIGEALLMKADGQFKIMPLYQFFEKIEHDPTFKVWIEELYLYFSSLRDGRKRQKVLIYGVIVAAFINHFDKKYQIARKRKLYAGKLRPESLKLINRSLFAAYLKFVDKSKLELPKT